MALSDVRRWGTSLREALARGGTMEVPEDVDEMFRLYELGVGLRSIAEQLGCSRNTVRRYLRQGGWQPYGGRVSRSKLAGLEDWLAREFHKHRGNADVVRQELARQHGVRVSLRTVERAVADQRQLLEAQRQATTRFETPPGRQLQVDFGSTRVWIGQRWERIYVFVATLGYSRRCYVQIFRNAQQRAWFEGLEGAFRHFGGVAEQVLVDNAKPLVTHHDGRTGEVSFHHRFLAFAAHWGFRAKACRPFRARTKGKDESGVGYVKCNGLAGHGFSSWASLESHLARWLCEIADKRIHGTTGERPIDRFRTSEAAALKSLNGRPSFLDVREVTRRVRSDCTVELDTNAYSVPWRLIGEDVRIQSLDGRILIHHGATEVARHSESQGRRQRITDDQHFAGIARSDTSEPVQAHEQADATSKDGLERPLQAYEQLIQEVAP